MNNFSKEQWTTLLRSVLLYSFGTHDHSVSELDCPGCFDEHWAIDRLNDIDSANVFCD